MIKLGKNQYLFTKESYDDIICVNAVEFADYKLYLGEDCKTLIGGNEKVKILVLGYAVDVLKPDKLPDEMVCDLADKIMKNDIGPGCTANWCGRWVVIALVNDKLTCWNDACGLKQVFYDTGREFIASQARYIADICGYMQAEAASEYMQKAKKSDKEYSLPVDMTMYSEIKRLLPNHILDVENKIVIRAALNIEQQSYDKAVKKCSQSICNAMEGASERFKLLVTLTAGWDSRIVLSACSKLHKDYDVITFKYDWMTDDNEDITVAGELCRELNIEHKVLLCRDCEDEFSEEYISHSENAHKYWIQMARAVSEYGDGILVKGSCNEILRMTSGNLYSWQITPMLLCKMFHIEVTECSLDAVGNWLKTAKKYCKENNINIPDLFYWEHRMGSWIAECCNENDVVGEMFTPFNSRNYLENGLSIPEKKRDGKDKQFILDILRENWTQRDIKKWIHINKSLIYKIKNRIKYKMPLVYGIYMIIKYTERRDK